MVDVPVEVKKAFKKGRTRKQYRIEVYTINDDNTLTYEFTIGNDNLVKESVKIDERMCSDRYLKFGLSEGSSMEFQYFGMESVTGKELKVYLDVWYDNGEGGAWYPIMMGYYEVDTSSTQFSTGIRKVTAYNKLQSKYLDQKANSLLLESVTNSNETINLYDIQRLLLQEYQVESVQKVELKAPEYAIPYSVDDGMCKGVKFSSETYATPINKVNMTMYGYTYNNTFYLAPEGMAWQFRLNPDYYYSLESNMDFSAWERSMYEYVKDLIGNSGLNLTGTGYFDWLITKTHGWRTMMMVELIKSDGTTISRYSDIGYEKVPSLFAGGFRDIINRTFTGYAELRFWLGRRMMNGETDHYQGNVFYTFGNENYWGPDYSYYTNDGTATYPTFKFPDGSDIPQYTSHSLDIDWFTCYRITDMSNANKVEVKPTEIAEFTLRDIISANYETVCQYGQLDRETDLFSGVELGGTGLYPSETLYPADNLYPNGNTGGKAIHPYPAEYQKLWTDTVGVQSFRYLRITYKTIEDGNEVEKVLQRTVHEHGTQNYNMSDNWLFLNLVWTAEQVGAYADAMVEKMRDITWFPFEMWSVGLPYVETGDAIEIADKEGNTYTSYILQRQLRGIQNLQDSFINGELDVF